MPEQKARFKMSDRAPKSDAFNRGYNDRLEGRLFAPYDVEAQRDLFIDWLEGFKKANDEIKNLLNGKHHDKEENDVYVRSGATQTAMHRIRATTPAA